MKPANQSQTCPLLPKTVPDTFLPVLYCGYMEIKLNLAPPVDRADDVSNPISLESTHA